MSGFQPKLWSKDLKSKLWPKAVVTDKFNKKQLFNKKQTLIKNRSLNDVATVKPMQGFAWRRHVYF